MSYNYNVAKPKVFETDKTVRSIQELRKYNDQNYVTISAAEGRKLMKRVTTPGPVNIERVLAKGQDEITTEEDDHPDVILFQSKDYVKRHKAQGAGSEFFQVLIETSKLQLTSLTFYQALAAEFMGVFILTLVVCGLGITLSADDKIPSFNGALGGGLTLATMIWVTNCISGGNLNPAVSFALVLSQDLDLLRGVFYIIFQVLGAIAGAATLKLVLPDSAIAQIAVTDVQPDVTLFKAFCIEAIITFLLTITVFACVDKRRKDLGGSYPLAIGLSVTAGALFGVSIEN